jgi:hypothetical protein
MIKLTDILNEARVIPQGIINKKQALDNLIDFNEYFLYSVVNSNTLEEFLKAYDYDTLPELLTGEYGYEEENLKDAIKVIESYYRAIQPEDIKMLGTGNKRTDISGYRYAEQICVGDDCFTILTKF